MSRRSKAYRVRVKKDGHFQTRLVQARSPRGAASRGKGRVLSSSKVSMEELLKVGDYFKLGKQLMEEFAEERRCKGETVAVETS